MSTRITTTKDAFFDALLAQYANAPDEVLDAASQLDDRIRATRGTVEGYDDYLDLWYTVTPDYEPVVHLTVAELAEATGLTVESWALPADAPVSIFPDGTTNGHDARGQVVYDLTAGNAEATALTAKVYAERAEEL